MVRTTDPKRATNYERFKSRPTPQWFKDTKLGIFIHWGPYSVPAWAEPTGRIGDLPPEILFPHDPYAEWYFNTMRFPDMPTAQHHAETYGDNTPYDKFLDMWTARDFDAPALVRMFKAAGASYIVPVSKHHDGVTLWDAPDTGDRNTVKRGPKRDLIKEWADACEAERIKFGVYYSTGIDWFKWPTPKPWQKHNDERPGIDAHEYNQYAWKHCQDLIKRYRPFVLWGDIDWPKAGVAPGPYSVEKLLDELYSANPEAVINDRYGETHWDFTTEEYGHGWAPEDPDEAWQSTRGIGLSFGYNQNEDESHSLSGRDAIRLLIDVASRGGNLLLNVGPDEKGNIPPVQMRCLEGMADWMKVHGGGIDGTRHIKSHIVTPIGGEGGDKTPGTQWIRWLRKEDEIFAFVDSDDSDAVITLDADWKSIDRGSACSLQGTPINVDSNGAVKLKELLLPMPGCVKFRKVGNLDS